MRGGRIGIVAVGGVAAHGPNQLTEADIVHMRDFTKPGTMADEQLKHLALIAHHCDRSFDLALQRLVLLEKKQVLPIGSSQRYLDL